MKTAPPRPAPDAGKPRLSAAQKAAIVLASLPRETAAAIVAEVGDAHLKSFVRAVSEMKSVPAQARLAIAQEFIAEVLRRKEELPGGTTEAQRILSEITDPARVERVMSDSGGAKTDAGALWRQAAALPADRLCAYVRQQRPPAIAAILASLPPEKAAEVLAHGPAEFAKPAIAAIARFSAPDAETNEAIAAAVEHELLMSRDESGDAAVASEPATAIFDLLPSGLRDGLMAYLDAADAPMAAALRKTLMTFEQFPARLNESAVAALFRSADRDTLMRALKHGETSAPQTVEFLLGNISKRMADQLREDLAALAAPSLEEGEAAQRALIAALKRLQKSGEIKLNPVT